ncbi:MAG: ferredoxin [Patescibacteria group bacterium]|nr:ferredoxin [Patescibacteria group bacterium]
MSIKVNHELCIGCGACEAVCPAVFKMNAVGKAEAVSQDDPGCTKAAAESCPVQAIEAN